MPPILLAIDIGNTSASFGIFGGKKLLSEWRMPISSVRGAPTLAKRIASKARGVKFDGVCIASVVPRLNRIFRLACRSAFGFPPVFVGPSRAGIRMSGYPARKIGVDRLLGAAAAFERHGRAVVVVDIGSAVTFDAVDSGGRFLGGAIAPGPGLMAASLSAMTVRLPRVAPQRPRRATGRDTRSCILSGVVLGAAGAVDRVVSEISKEMREKPVVVATGGFAGLIAPLSRTISRVHPNLVLEGLSLAWERSRRRIDNAAG